MDYSKIEIDLPEMRPNHIKASSSTLYPYVAGGLESSGHFSSILWILNFSLEHRIPGLQKKKYHASPKNAKKQCQIKS